MVVYGGWVVLELAGYQPPPLSSCGLYSGPASPSPARPCEVRGEVAPESSLSYPPSAIASFPWILRCLRREEGWV